MIKHIVNNICKLGYYELGTMLSNLSCFKTDLSIDLNIGGHRLINDTTYFKNSVLIYQSSNYSEIALSSDIILPETSFIEKESLFFTLNNGLSITKKVYEPSKEAKESIVFLQYFLFLLYKMPLQQEAHLVADLNNLKIKDFKGLLQTRLLKRSLFYKANKGVNFLSEPFSTCLLNKTIFSNIINLYYSTDLLSKNSFNLLARSKIEESMFLNFDQKNVVI